MRGYGQFCPVALASEVLAERWTPLIVRELLAGSHRFSELQRGLPRIPRALLVQRLGSPRTTPPFPEYPSAHACHSGALATILAALFGSGRVDFTLDSLVTGQTRSYPRFADVLREVNDARVWAGFHFRTSDVAGAILGRRVGGFVLTRVAARRFVAGDGRLRFQAAGLDLA